MAICTTISTIGAVQNWNLKRWVNPLNSLNWKALGRGQYICTLTVTKLRQVNPTPSYNERVVPLYLLKSVVRVVVGHAHLWIGNGGVWMTYAQNVKWIHEMPNHVKLRHYWQLLAWCMHIPVDEGALGTINSCATLMPHSLLLLLLLLLYFLLLWIGWCSPTVNRSQIPTHDSLGVLNIPIPREYIYFASLSRFPNSCWCE